MIAYHNVSTFRQFYTICIYEGLSNDDNNN